MAKWIQIETQRGNPVDASGWRLTPLSRALRIMLPWMKAGLVWNRPSAVIVEGPGQPERTVRIEDATRLAQVAILGGLFSTLFVVLILTQARR